MSVPVYQGRDSCMARREGWYVRRIEHPGVDTIAEAVALAWAILRDYRRGHTYDNDSVRCRKIRMTWKLAERRLVYLMALAKKHGASKREQAVIKRLVEHVLEHRRLPKRVDGRSVESIVKHMIVKVEGGRRG
ncbi:MAG: hypothetical protein GSR80_000047 [Desulfurococcales archaeon]|nr:hypothetical protein [Desulfurococcales archaeon]